MPYRGRDRRGDAVVTAPSPRWLLLWPALGLAGAALTGQVGWDGQPSQFALGLVVSGLLLAGVGRTSARATGEAAAARLAAAGALLAVAGGASVAGATVGAAAATGLAALSVLQLLRTPDIDTAVLRDRTLAAAAAIGLLGAAAAEAISRVLELTWLATSLHLLAALAWAFAVAEFGRPRSSRAGPVPRLAAALAAAAGTASVLHLVATASNRSYLAAAGSAVAVLGTGWTLLGLVHSLGRRLEDRRADLHVGRARHERDDREREAARRTAAHEARNALTGIEAAGWRLRRAPEITEDVRREIIGVIANSLGRLKVALLPGEAIEGERADVADVLGSAVWLARGRGTRVIVESLPEAEAACPPSVLGQVLDNLLLNAHLHGRAGTSPVTIAVSDGDRIRIDVRDQGPGIVPELGEDVFLAGTRHGATAGEGIGLAVTRDLVRAHGGEITLERSTTGASFRVDLPAAGPSATAAVGTAEERDDHG